ncbi:hypothetical protein [Sedimentibacter sp. MB31-C6]|uniref:hypothetical protein n=1 Tax=Sedimentibacter sp. MB31-C6 TaxID=3109366 RepID=UPI002DDD9F4A|nr:hypothetical protein [Sedimentibacter sp. MB36-C1]WSI03595.1 hypothetical protein U8307_11110 [Sedimentibacter sp. MB36-C1]
MNGLDIARLQTAFGVSYEMVLVRLKSLNILNDDIYEKLKLEQLILAKRRRL